MSHRNRKPNAVLAGTGNLFYAELNGQTPEPEPASPPSTVDSDPGGNYEGVGFTDQGVSLEWDFTSEAIVVAESASPIRTLWTEVDYRLALASAQFEPRVLTLALNGGTTNTVPGPPATRTFTPPDLGQDTARTLLFQFTNETGGGSHLYMPVARNSSSVSIPFQRAPQKSVIALEFHAEVPPSGPIWTITDAIVASS